CHGWWRRRFPSRHRIALADFDAGVADAARLGNRMVFRTAVQSHRQNSSDGGFSDTAVSAEDVSMGDALLLDSVLERSSDVVLPNDVGELLGPVFAGKDLVAHGNFHYRGTGSAWRTQGDSGRSRRG